MGPDRTRLALYSLGHFWVDFSCALLMFAKLSGGPDWGLCVLLYNFCAFALQMPAGLLADRLDRNGCAAAAGCALVLAGWGFCPWPVAAAAVAGLGNACFHVGGGIDILNRSETRAAALGIFVSPGAFGIFFGTLLGRGGSLPWYIPAAGLVLFGLLFPLADLRLRGSLRSGNAPLALDLSGAALWAFACCFLVVALRSYVGMVLSFPWKTGGWALAVTCGVVLGKAAGGFLGDKLGMTRAAVLSLGLSAALFLLSGFSLAGTAAVFLFNMTMPVTLWAAARLTPGAKGFAFGALTFALFLGFLPVFLGWNVPLAGGGGYALGALASLGLLALGLRAGRL